LNLTGNYLNGNHLKELKKLKLLKSLDLSQCGIGFHGDGERRKVFAVRMGETMPLYFKWFQNSQSVGEPFELVLNDGDMYIMSEKAVGFDWLKKKIPTLRHSTGCSKFTGIKSANEDQIESLKQAEKQKKEAEKAEKEALKQAEKQKKLAEKEALKQKKLAEMEEKKEQKRLQMEAKKIEIEAKKAQKLAEMEAKKAQKKTKK
jgi:hypothetical protein